MINPYLPKSVQPVVQGLAIEKVNVCNCKCNDVPRAQQVELPWNIN